MLPDPGLLTQTVPLPHAEASCFHPETQNTKTWTFILSLKDKNS